MKVRQDFVTNSSSSSFILARNSKLNERQKEEIEEVFEKYWSFDSEEAQQEVLKALKEGKSIYRGDVCYDEAEYHYGNVFSDIWRIMEENGDDTFIAIDEIYNMYINETSPI